MCLYLRFTTLMFDYPSGAGLFASGIGNIQNNSILEPTPGGRILCLSGSNMSTVGEWRSPAGRNLAAVRYDPFFIVFGDSNNPGQLSLLYLPITMTYEGVYTCAIPDENGDTEYVHVGIYLTPSKSVATCIVREIQDYCPLPTHPGPS